MPTTTEEEEDLLLPIRKRESSAAEARGKPLSGQNPSSGPQPESQGSESLNSIEEPHEPPFDRQTLWEAIEAYCTILSSVKTAEGKIYSYDGDTLLDWRALLVTSGTVFNSWQTLEVVPFVFAITTVTAVITCVAFPDASTRETQQFTELAEYFEVFIAIILGFYVSSSYQRWWFAVLSFKQFLTSIKNLIFSLNATGLREDLKTEVRRLSVAACFVLHHEIHISTMADESFAHREECWKKSMRQVMDAGFLTRSELEHLDRQQKQVESDHWLGVHSLMLWRWIGDVMSEVRKEPNVAPPMYVRLLSLCQACVVKIEDLKTGITVQLPYSKAHMMSTLVRLSNIVMALSCGMAIGSAMSQYISHGELEGRSSASDAMSEIRKQARVLSQAYGALQVCSMQIVQLFFVPLIYQAFLVIAHQLCYPYGSEDFHMPTVTFIEQMEMEMRLMMDSRDMMRSWIPERWHKELSAKCATPPASARESLAASSKTQTTLGEVMPRPDPKEAKGMCGDDAV